MPTTPPSPKVRGPARAPARPPGKRAERRATVGPPPVPPKPAPGMPGRRWTTRTNPWPSARDGGVRRLPATSTLPSRRAGRAGTPGRSVIRTRAPSPVEIRAVALVPTSGRRRAAVGSTATTCPSRPVRPSTSIGTSPMSRTSPTSPPTSLRAVAALRPGQTAPTRHTTRSRGSVTAVQSRRTSPEESRVPSAGVDHGNHADPRLSPGSTTPKSKDRAVREACGSRGAARTPAFPGPSSPVAPRRSRIRRGAPARLAPAPRERMHRR
jgi:hypothetical protein